ncbi:phosphotransferase family protein [Salinirubrum litoreum]|uniref:Phosphotransferase family protein n=1 Tax=Salinirubrum litoreum TaxID=1126234 RepID=A0ABD5R9Y7_9EURY|nr:aminoglycoside phosphotransferase family protein [Salinirubrum litoreum]
MTDDTDDERRATTDDARTVLDREFPDREIAGLATSPRGNRKRTVFVTFGDGSRVVVQLATLPVVRTETALARLVGRRTSIPVPQVRAVGQIDDRGYAVTDAVPGDDLHTRFAGFASDRQRALCRTFGRGLAELHELSEFDSYGPVAFVGDWEKFVGGVRRGEDAPGPDSFGVVSTDEKQCDVTALPGRTPSDDWHAWLRNYVDTGLRALPAEFDDLRDRLTTVIDADVAEDRVPPAPTSRLFPWDFRPGNALVADDRVTAMLDWGEPLAADPALSVAKTEHLLADWYVEPPANTDLRRAFRAGYESVRPIPSVPSAYRVVAVVLSAVDSTGEVTRPRYPELTGDDAVAFHRERLLAALGDAG